MACRAALAPVIVDFCLRTACYLHVRLAVNSTLADVLCFAYKKDGGLLSFSRTGA
jgi:hypothetical protein